MQPAIALLQWYIDAGVDEATLEEPRSFLLPERQRDLVTPPVDSKPAIESKFSAPVSTLQHSPSAASAKAEELIQSINTLEELENAVRQFDGCALKRTATNTVFADGVASAKLMLIGEAPGAQEDAQGIPFCGDSGVLLDKMLAAIEFDRKKNAYITNTVFWRPPGNRQPTSEEIAICAPFVAKHIALIDPALIVLVGGTAAKSILGTELGITRLRGKHYLYTSPINKKEYPVRFIYHPSYLLRQPAQKRVTWQDLQEIKATMQSFL